MQFALLEREVAEISGREFHALSRDRLSYQYVTALLENGKLQILLEGSSMLYLEIRLSYQYVFMTSDSFLKHPTKGPTIDGSTDSVVKLLFLIVTFAACRNNPSCVAVC